MSKLPRLLWKEYFQDQLEKLGVKVVEDGFKTGVKKEVQGMVIQLDEQYDRPQLNSSNLISTLQITIQLNSEVNETLVHKAIMDLMALNAASPNLPTYRIKSFKPVSSSTEYVSEASQGFVVGLITIEIVYFM